MHDETRLPRILIAEDNPADVLIVREALRRAGLACASILIKDGEQAIAFIDALDRGATSCRIDIALIDMHLPKRNGMEILRRLRSTEFHAQTPVVFMTSSGLPDSYCDAGKQAFLHYFKKPMTLDGFMELGVIVSDILSARAPRRVISKAQAKVNGSSL